MGESVRIALAGTTLRDEDEGEPAMTFGTLSLAVTRSVIDDAVVERPY